MVETPGSARNVFFMTGVDVRDPMPPDGCWEFGHCHRLLKLFPAWRRRLVRDWTKLERLYEQRPGERNQRLYDAMNRARGWS